MKWLVTLMVVCVLATASAVAQGAKQYKARLSLVPILQTQVGAVTGSGSVTATLTGNKLSLNGTFEGLQSPATVARLHRGVKKGVRGPAVSDLKVSGTTSGTIEGTVDLTQFQVNDLASEHFYVQLHSEKSPDGNLWGWLQLQENKR